MLFWYLYYQLHGCKYREPSQTCMFEFLEFNRQKLKFSKNFQMGSKYTSEALNRFYFD